MFFILTDSKRDEDAEKDWQSVGEAERERERLEVGAFCLIILPVEYLP